MGECAVAVVKSVMLDRFLECTSEDSVFGGVRA